MGIKTARWCLIDEVHSPEARSEPDALVRVYIDDLVSIVTTYEKVLRGFQRVHLKPGEIKTISFTLTPEDLALWDRSMRFVVEPGTFTVMVGPSSSDIRVSGDFEVVRR